MRLVPITTAIPTHPPAEAGRTTTTLGQAAVAVTLSLLASAASAAVFDASADFSASSNPNGAWAYGETFPLGSTFVRGDTHGANLGIDYWLHSDKPAFHEGSTSMTGAPPQGMVAGIKGPARSCGAP